MVVPGAARMLVAAQHLAARNLDRGAGVLLARAGLEQQPRDGSDGGQRLAAKSERGDREQIFYVAQLAGGVALEGQQRVVAQHAVAVVGDADQAAAACVHFHANLRRARVERVLQQLFYDRGGALHHLSGRDFIRDGVGENADLAHGPR